jgi:hypothetical protein
VDRPVIIPVSNSDRNLDEFDSEKHRAATAASLMVVVDPEAPQPSARIPFSRVEAAKARRVRKRFLARVRSRVRNVVDGTKNAARRTLQRRQRAVHEGASAVLAAITGIITRGLLVFTSISHRGRAGAQAATGRVTFTVSSIASDGRVFCTLISLRCDSLRSAVSGAAVIASGRMRRGALASVEFVNEHVASLVANGSRNSANALRHVRIAASTRRALARQQVALAMNRSRNLATRRLVPAIERGRALTQQSAKALRHGSMVAKDYVARTTQRGIQAVQLQVRPNKPRDEEGPIRHLESEGALVATALAVVVIGYGVRQQARSPDL